MHRRRFLQSLLAASGSAALGSWALLRSLPAHAAEAAAFHTQLQRTPWLLGWRSVTSPTFGADHHSTAGQTSRRTGQAACIAMARPGLSAPGSATNTGSMAMAWCIAGSWAAPRYSTSGAWWLRINSPRNSRPGVFCIAPLAPPCPTCSRPADNDDVNTANTSVAMLNGRLFALWEAGSAIELDPDALRTLGPVTWRDDLAAMPFSAHPLIDRDGRRMELRLNQCGRRPAAWCSGTWAQMPRCVTCSCCTPTPPAICTALP